MGDSLDLTRLKTLAMKSPIRSNATALCLTLLPFVHYGQNIGIGISTPQAKLHIVEGSAGVTPFVFTRLAVESGGHTYLSLLSPNSQETAVLFGNPSNAAGGALAYNNLSTPNGFQFRTGGLNRISITNNGLVGINNTFPQATLDVSGSIKTSSITVNNGGAQGDFLVKQDAAGQVTNRKGYVGFGLNYIIAVQGSFPNLSSPQQTGNPYIGEIRLFAGTYAPFGWMFCQGQLLDILNNQTLFAIIGTTYGGNGVNNFALPDLRNAVPVGASSGGTWQYGEKSQ